MFMILSNIIFLIYFLIGWNWENQTFKKYIEEITNKIVETHKLLHDFPKLRWNISKFKFQEICSQNGNPIACNSLERNKK